MGEKMHERALGDLQIEVATLRAIVARQGEAIRELVDALDSERGVFVVPVESHGRAIGATRIAGARRQRIDAFLDAPAPDAAPDAGPVIHVLRPGLSCAPWGVEDPYWCGQPHHPGSETDGDGWSLNPMDATCQGCVGALLDVPAPPADAPLPGPVAEAVAWMRREHASRFFDSDIGAKADALAAWARAQQQPALPADVREAMQEAATSLSEPKGSTYGAIRASDIALAARLRELAGAP